MNGASSVAWMIMLASLLKKSSFMQQLHGFLGQAERNCKGTFAYAHQQLQLAHGLQQLSSSRAHSLRMVIHLVQQTSLALHIGKLWVFFISS